MAQDRRELFDRVEARNAELAHAQDSKALRKARRRRMRREQRPARLRFIPTDGGGTLWIPQQTWVRALCWLGAVYVLWASASTVYHLLSKTVLSITVDYVWLSAPVVAGLLTGHLLASVAATRRIDVMAGRGYIMRQRTLIGTLRIVESGEDPEIKFTFAKSGLLNATFGGWRVFSLGEADMATLRAACTSARLPFREPTTEQRDRADLWEGRGVETYVLQTIFALFAAGGGTVAFLLYSQQAKLDEYAAPELPEAAALAGLVRSRGAETWGEWEIQPSRVVHQSKGATVLFPEGSPVRELRVQSDHPELKGDFYLEWHFANEAEPRVVNLGESCRKYKLSTQPCRNPDDTLDAGERTKTRLRFECWGHGLDGTIISNCPHETP